MTEEPVSFGKEKDWPDKIDLIAGLRPVNGILQLTEIRLQFRQQVGQYTTARNIGLETLYGLAIFER